MDLQNDSFTAMKRLLLYDSIAVKLILIRIANEIYAHLREKQEPIAIAGILRRGAPIADILYQELLKKISNDRMIRIDIKVKRYADDLSILYPNTLLTLDPLLKSCNLTNYHVVLVDDVMFTGKSMLKVIEFIATKNPKSIITACLVDRLYQQVPVISQYSGIKLQVNEQMIVECNIPPYEPTMQIVLASPPGYLLNS